jgi:hypothetical protein
MQSRSLAATLLALFLTTLVACSSGTSATDGQHIPDGGSDNDGTVLDSGLGRDGGTGNDGATGNDGGGGNDVGIVGVGNVTLSQTVVTAVGQMFPSYVIGALFSTVTSTVCAQTTVSQCVVTSCQAGASVVPISAGNVTVSGGQLATPKVLTPGPNGYMSFHANMRAFDVGDVLTMTAAGAANGVPAFSTTVMAPSEAIVSAPMFVAGQTMTIDRTHDLQITWTATGAATTGSFVASLSLTPSAQVGSVTVICSYPIASGTATVPSSTLMMIPAGMGAISIGTHGSSMVVAGEFAVTAAAVSFAKTSSGAVASAGANFQ